MAATDDELTEMAHDLFKRLGGIGNKDARIVRGLLCRWGDAKQKAARLRIAGKSVETAYRTRPLFELFGAVDRMSDVLAETDAITPP